jgi:hypothetical protein
MIWKGKEKKERHKPWNLGASRPERGGKSKTVGFCLILEQISFLSFVGHDVFTLLVSKEKERKCSAQEWDRRPEIEFWPSPWAVFISLPSGFEAKLIK